jgi:transcriptional regulator with XRE-family HTH domain
MRLETWRGSVGYREIAARLECSPALLTGWKQGKTPATAYLERLESLADVPPLAWSYWVKTPKKARLDAPPASVARTPSNPPPASVAPESEGIAGPSVPRINTADELRVSVARLSKLLGSPKLSPVQVATLEGKRITALSTLARLEQSGPLEEHPEFSDFITDTLDAFKETITAFGVELSPALQMYADLMRRKGDEYDARKGKASKNAA